MNNDLKLLQFIETHLQQNQTVVLMVVVESSGRSPVRQGFKMAVAEDGTLFGSISGGVVEVNLVETAKEFLVSTDDGALKKFGHSSVFGQEQVHRENSEYSSGMSCSGKQHVVFVKMNPSELNKIRSFSSALTKNKKGIFEITDRGFWIVTPQMENFADYQGSEDWSGTSEELFEKYWSVIEGKFLVAYTFNNWGYSEKLGY
jgi:xanthine dehydrogenase accessory factor